MPTRYVVVEEVDGELKEIKVMILRLVEEIPNNHRKDV